MSHFAQIDENNIVVRVVVCDDSMPNEGLDMLNEAVGGRWIKTSYNTIGGVHLLGGTPFRMNFAAIGGVYDEARDAFIPPKPYPSWVLNDETLLWEAPVPRPSDPDPFVWDEESVSWVSPVMPKPPVE